MSQQVRDTFVKAATLNTVPPLHICSYVSHGVAGVMLVCSMFYTRTEIGERIGWLVLFLAHNGAYASMLQHRTDFHIPRDLDSPSILTYNK